MSEPRARSFHVVTVVWGRPYVDLFLNVAVPNQMTPGNLGALPSGSRYRVFTSPDDAEALAADPALRRVNELMPVDIVAMPELVEPTASALIRTTAGHCRALADARTAQAGLLFLNADFFLSEGAMAAMVRRHAAGARAVVTMGARVNKETFVANLEMRGVRSLASRDLVSLALDNLHPFTMAHMVDSARTARNPIWVCWNVRGEGILSRAFFLQPLMVDPLLRDVLPRKGFTIDANYVVGACPQLEDIHVVSDSDELCFFELSHEDGAVTEIDPGGMSVWRTARRLRGGDRLTRKYWAQPIRLHVGDITSAWDPVERESASFAGQALRWYPVIQRLHLTGRRLRRVLRRGRELGKRALRATRPLWPRRVKRLLVHAVKRIQKVAERAGRDVRRPLKSVRRSALILRHSFGRPLLKHRKRVIRAGRRILRRAQARLAH